MADVSNPTEEQVAQYSQDAENIDALSKQPDQSQTIENPVQPPSDTPPQVNTPNNPIATNPAEQVANQAQEGNDIKQKAMGVPSKASQNFTESPIPMVNPAVKRASTMYSIAEALSGGPRYKYNIDANTGKMTREPVPVSGKHLGLALALEALSGGLTGLAAGRGRGPGAAGAAAEQQAQQRVQQQDAQARQEANANYARSAAIAKTNMTMLRNEQVTAQADEEFQQKDVDTHSGIYSDLSTLGAIKEQGLTSDQIMQRIAQGKGNVTKDMFIPYRVIPMTDKDGKPVLTTHGAPKFEKLYAQIDPTASLNPPKELLDKAVKYKIPGFVNPNTGEALPLPSDVQLKAHMVVGLAEQVRKFEMNDEAAKRYNDSLESGQSLAHVAHSGTTDEGLAGQSASKISNPQLADITDKAADKYSLPPELLHAVGLQESNGNPAVANSKPNAKGVYAVGPFQVTMGTARTVTGNPNLTEADLKDPETNADISAHYLSNLIQANGGDMHKALVAYHGAGADSLGMTGEKYADQVMSKMGQSTPMPKSEDVTGTKGTPVMSPTEAISKNLLAPQDMDTLQKLGTLVNLLDGNHSTKDIENRAARDKTITQDSVGRILSQYGTAIDERYNQKQQQLQNIKDANTLKLTGEKTEQKNAIEAKYAAQSQSYLKDVPNFHDIPNIMEMTPMQAKQALQAQGVPVPPEIGALMQVANYGGTIEKYFPSKTYKGTATISAQDAASYIKNYLNPTYSEPRYGEAKIVAQDYGNQSVGKPGGQLNATDTASQHLNVLMGVADGLKNGSLPDANAVYNYMAQHLGSDKPLTFTAVAQILGQEVSKVAGGGAALQSELEKFDQNLNKNESPQQIKGVVDAYVNLMQGRLSTLNNTYRDYFHKDVRAMTPETAKVFGSRGLYVPGWGDPMQDAQGNFIGFSKDGGKTYKPIQ